MCRPYFRQEARRIDWPADSSETVLRKLRGADSQPGVLDELLGAQWYLHGGHPDPRAAARTRRLRPPEPCSGAGGLLGPPRGGSGQ